MKHNDVILKFDNVCKYFPGVKALDKVSFEVYRGEIHALMGANGAGKSTLIKIVAGMFNMDSGSVTIDGTTLSHIKSASVTQKLGVSVVFQELNVMPDLSVLENIFICKEPTKGPIISWKQMKERTQKILDDLEIDFDLNTKVKELSIAQQQMVEIVKAVSFGAKIIFFDEPTSSLSNKETLVLFDIMKRLNAQGVTIIYVSHRLNEIYDHCERLSLLRDGQWILTKDLKDLPRTELIQNMVGRKLDDEYPRHEANFGEEILRIENFTGDRFKDISFSVKSGEVLGIAGLVGAGRTDVAKAIFGEYKKDSGTVYIQNEKVIINSPRAAITYGIAYVTEDRKNEGLMLELNLRQNITISSLKEVVRNFLFNFKLERKISNKFMNDLRVKATSSEQKAVDLSGGNQQKICLAKWLMTKPKVLILDEPTRGIDVGAKAEFYRIIAELAKEGVAVVVISSEEDELIGISDRIICMFEGSISGEIDKVNNECESRLMEYMLGV
jgi:ABC-type sugar transport system ATPase subunit